MAEIRVQDEQGVVHVFPDGSTPEMIAKVMGVKAPSQGFTNAQFQQETKAQSTPQSQPGFVQDIKDQTKNLGLGFVKSAMQTQASSPIGATVPGMTSVQPVDVHDPALKLEGTAQHVGGGLEQTGEMFLTGGPLRGVIQNAAMRVPLLGRYLGPGARVASEAINASANAAGHGQDPNSAALVGAIGAAGSEALPSVAEALQKAAVGQYTRALAPTKEVNKVAAERVVPGLIDRGIVGSPKSIAATASQNLQTAGQAVRSAENAISPASISDVTPVLNKLQDLRGKYTVGGAVPTSRASTVDYIDSLKNDILMRSRQGQMLTSDLIQFRRLLDEPVAQSGGYLGSTVLGNKQIDKAAANSMREILNQGNPDLAAANASYSFWSNVRKVAADTAKRQTGQQGAIKTVMTAAGMAGGLSHGGFSPAGAGEAAAGAAGMYLLTSAVRSPQWRTASAVMKNRIADALTSDNAEQMARAVTDFFASSASQSASK